MSHESGQDLRDQLEAMQRNAVKQARRCATMFGVISIVALIAFVYGFVRKVEAERMSEIAIENERSTLRAEMDARAQRDELVAVRAMLDSCRNSSRRTTK